MVEKYGQTCHYLLKCIATIAVASDSFDVPLDTLTTCLAGITGPDSYAVSGIGEDLRRLRVLQFIDIVSTTLPPTLTISQLGIFFSEGISMTPAMEAYFRQYFPSKG